MANYTRFTFPLGIIGWPYLDKLGMNPRYGSTPKFSCVILTDFAQPFMLAAREANGGVDPDFSCARQAAPMPRNMGFRYSVFCQSLTMPASVDHEGRAIDPLRIIHGSRVRVSVDMEPGRFPIDQRRVREGDTRRTFVVPALRMVALLGGPIERAPSMVPYDNFVSTVGYAYR